MLVGCLSLWDRLLLKCVYRVGLLSLWDRLFLKYVYGGGLLSLWVELVGWAVLKTGRTMVLARGAKSSQQGLIRPNSH